MMIGCCDDDASALGAVRPIDAGSNESQSEMLKFYKDVGVSLGARPFNCVIG